MYIHYSMTPEQVKADLTKNNFNNKVSGGLDSIVSVGGPNSIEQPQPVNPHMNMVLPQILGTTSYQQVAQDAL